MVKKFLILAVFVLIIFFLSHMADKKENEEPFSQPEEETAVVESFLLSGFENDNEGWSLLENGEVLRSRKYASEGNYSLQIPLLKTSEIVISKKGDFHWFDFDMLSFDTYVPSDSNGKEVYISVVDDENFWYQTEKPFILSDGWNNYRIDISPSTKDMLPVGHYRPWSGFISNSLKEINIKFQGKTPFSAPMYVDNIRIEKKVFYAAGPLIIKDLYVNTARVEKYSKFEVGFSLSREYMNPFDPEEIDITGVFISPSGKEFRVPAFFYQEYSRRLVNGEEHLLPVGKGRWLVRFAPEETGKYKYCLRIKDRKNSIKTKNWEFSAIPSSNPGYLRISRADRRYFEFESGAFFYPVGLNIISPWDTPYQQRYVDTLPVGLGTYAYDDYLNRMYSNRMNFFRMWMAHWWLALEWNPEKGPFKGIGRYNLGNAWRLDHIVQQAEKYQIYILLTINNHTQLTGHEKGWETNPYNKINGGFLGHPGEFFTDPEARKFFKQKLRYIMARWGYSTSIFAWDLWSEVDLTGGFNSNNVRDWHNEMGAYIKKNNPFNQMVTTHFCISSRALQWEMPEGLDFIHSNGWVNVDGFSDSQIEAILQYYDRMKKFGKPAFISEYGGHWAGSEKEIMIRDLHTGLWANYMTPLAGSPQFWWWNLVDEENLYFHYKALASFTEGEDRRGKDLQQKTVAVEEETGHLSAIALGNSNTAYVWVYNFLTALRIPAEKKLFGNAQIIVNDMENGKYRIEFWDTYTGKIAGEKISYADNGILKVKLPDIETDIACKIKGLREQKQE